jgi:hypothetical protein
MPIIRRDNQELRYNAIWLLPKQNNPDYWTNFFRNIRAFFYGFQREDLLEALDTMIYEMLEKPMGAKLPTILIVYKNLKFHNAFTRSKNPLYAGVNIYKYTLEEWLNEIENWCFKQVITLEPEIRFQTPARQHI